MARTDKTQNAAKPSIKEVAAVAGVSPTTVSRVLNNRGYISQQTRDNVHRAMEQIGYTPNDVARAMLNGRLNLIGIIVPFVSNPFHGQVVQVVERSLADNGFKLMLCNSGNRPDLERAYVDMLRRNMVDGIIVSSLNPEISEYMGPGMALVGIDCDLGEDAVQVASDNACIGEIATRRLLESGCRRILCIRSNSRMRMPSNKRTDAYLQVMHEADLEPLVCEIEFVKSNEEKAAAVAAVLDGHPDVDGIFAGDDSMAAICLGVLRTRGVRVPEDIRVVGVDGARQTLTFLPELTTVCQPIDLIAQTAAAAMIDLIDGKRSEDLLDLPVALREGTTA